MSLIVDPHRSNKGGLITIVTTVFIILLLAMETNDFFRGIYSVQPLSILL